MAECKIATCDNGDIVVMVSRQNSTFIHKYDSMGNRKWSTRLYYEVIDLKVAPNGGVVVGGKSDPSLHLLNAWVELLDGETGEVKWHRRL